MKRVVVTAGRSPLGRRVAESLRNTAGVDHVARVESRPASKRSDDANIDIVALVPDHRPFADYLENNGIDTLVQCDVVADRSGLASHASGADVITAMCVGAVVGHARNTGAAGIRNWVIASSSAIYPISSHAPRFQREDQQLSHEEDSRDASIAEAEDYARDVANRHPNLNVSILRLQEIAGPKARGPLASLLAKNPIPVPIGFDPSIQLLHIDDAAAAIAFAAERELAGVYNVASSGTIHWHDAVNATGHFSMPVLPASAAWLEPLLETLRVPFAPADLIDLLRYGHAVDTAKIERAGWLPRHDQHSCLSALG